MFPGLPRWPFLPHPLPPERREEACIPWARVCNVNFRTTYYLMTPVIHIQERGVTQPPGEGVLVESLGPRCPLSWLLAASPLPCSRGIAGGGTWGKERAAAFQGHPPTQAPSGRVGPKLEDERKVIRQSGWRHPRTRDWHVQRPWGRTQLGPRGRDEARGWSGGGRVRDGPRSSGPWEGYEGGLGCEAYSQHRVNHQRGMV